MEVIPTAYMLIESGTLTSVEFMSCTRPIPRRKCDIVHIGDRAACACSAARRLQEDLSEKLGAKVVFQHSSKGKGKMMIHYNSIDELDGILEHIK